MASSLKITITTTDGAEIFSQSFEKYSITFGRNPKMDIHLDYEFISRSHGNFTFENGHWFLNDLESSNGTFIDSKRITRVKVTDGIKIQLGRLLIAVQINENNNEEIYNEPGRDLDDEKTAPTIVVSELIIKDKKARPKSSAATSVKVERAAKTSTATPLIHVERGLQAVSAPVSRKSEAKSSPKKQMDSAVVDSDFSIELWGVHPKILNNQNRNVEAVVTWHNQVYDVQEFRSGDVITMGPTGFASLRVPTLSEPVKLAQVDQAKINCQIPFGAKVSLDRTNSKIAMGDLISSQELKQNTFGYSLSMDFKDVTHIELESGIAIHFRYVPVSPPLPNWRGSDSENVFKQSIISSFALHGALLLLILWAAPSEIVAPKLKNVPERYARLLVEKPKPKPTPLPTPMPRPPEVKKEVVKKTPPLKKSLPVKVVHKIMKPPKVIEKVNKFPIVVQHPVAKAQPPVKIENLGALAALGAISKDPMPSVVKNISINKNAGGLQTKSVNTSGVMGALPSTNGALLAVGTRVKTKGVGFGTGAGYGTQGLKGSAGSLAVAGAVVGEPKLAKSVKVEGLTRAQVMSVVQKYLSEVQHCYERNLLSDPNLAGRMEFEWDIASSGSVTAVRVKRSTVNNGDSLGECVKGLFGSMKFPRATNGQTTTPSIGFPFGRL